MATYNDEAALRKLHDEILCAFNSRDLDKLLSLYSDNIILMEPDMPAITGKDEVIQLFKKFQQQKLVYKLDYTIEKLEVFGKTAFVHVQVMKQIAQSHEEQEAGKFITLSQKQDDGRWLMHAIVNSAPSNFSFFDVHFINRERMGKVTTIHDGFPEESMKNISAGALKDLAYQMILSTVNSLRNNPIVDQALLKPQTDIQMMTKFQDLYNN